MLIINNRFLSLYDYNFLHVIEKIFSVQGVERYDRKTAHRITDTRLNGERFQILLAAAVKD